MSWERQGWQGENPWQEDPWQEENWQNNSWHDDSWQDQDDSWQDQGHSWQDQDNSWQDQDNSWQDDSSCRDETWKASSKSWKDSGSWQWQDELPQQGGASASSQGNGHGNGNGSKKPKSKRGHGSLEDVNARNRREIRRWRDDKHELEKARYTIQQQEDLIDNLRGMVWCEEDATQELTERAESLQNTMFEMADTIREMSEQVDALKEEAVDSMRSRMKAEGRVAQLQQELKKQRTLSTLEVSSKDQDLKDMQAKLDAQDAEQSYRLDSLHKDFKRYQAGRPTCYEKLCYKISFYRRSTVPLQHVVPGDYKKVHCGVERTGGRWHFCRFKIAVS